LSLGYSISQETTQLKSTKFQNFKSAKSKLIRAKRKSTELKSIVDKFAAKKPYKLRTKFNLLGNFYELGIERTVPIPDELIGTVNEIVHILRSALDNLAVDLVLRNGGSTDRVYYPIANSKEGFERFLQSGSLGQIDQGIINELRQFETYKGGKGDLIHSIHHYDVGDKHHQDATPFPAVRVRNIEFRYPNDSFHRIPGMTYIWNEDSSIFSEIPIGTKIKFDEAILVGIYIGPPNTFGRIPVPRVTDIACDFVSEIVHTLSLNRLPIKRQRTGIRYPH
jgi:hypothetical protein